METDVESEYSSKSLRNMEAVTKKKDAITNRRGGRRDPHLATHSSLGMCRKKKLHSETDSKLGNQSLVALSTREIRKTGTSL